jgi:succinate dehydrogenase / fumarate reductase cytochrome b subunit
VLNFVRNRAARPHGYAGGKKWAGGPSRKSISSTTMIVTGVITFVFVFLHLKTFKYGPYYGTAEPGVRDLYRLLIEVFQSPVYVVFYVVCMVLVGMHLRHGIASSLQSLGLMPAGWTRAILASCLVLAVVIGAGFAIIPIAVYWFL